MLIKTQVEMKNLNANNALVAKGKADDKKGYSLV